jgi:hypothetical protein
MSTGGTALFSTGGWPGVELEAAAGFMEDAGAGDEAIVDTWEQKRLFGLVWSKFIRLAGVCLVCSGLLVPQASTTEFTSYNIMIINQVTSWNLILAIVKCPEPRANNRQSIAEEKKKNRQSG